jgi:twitching motility protein PilT
MDITSLFAEALRLSASDLHLVVGYPPILRVAGQLTPISGANPLTAADTESLIIPTFLSEEKEIFFTNKEIDYSVAFGKNRFRGNVYYQKESIAADFRLIPDKIGTIEELGLPGICRTFAKLRQGFVLVTGPTGHGKSTTLASMINTINQTRAVHVVTIEDPIEYVYPPGMSIISQREMHQDTHSWNIALRSVLREDPDVVLIGEMRDLETIQAAMTIAETGHLVFATLHTNSASQTIDRIVDVFPESQQQQIRLQLSAVIEGVISMRLVPAISGGRVVVAEIMTATPAVKTNIRDGKSHLLGNIIQTSAELGMVTLEAALARAVHEGKISLEVAQSYAIDPEDLNRLLKEGY